MIVGCTSGLKYICPSKQKEATHYTKDFILNPRITVKRQKYLQ